VCNTLKEQNDMVAQPGSLTFNTVITKLNAGQQIFSNTVVNPDLEAAKKAATVAPRRRASYSVGGLAAGLAAGLARNR